MGSYLTVPWLCLYAVLALVWFGYWFRSQFHFRITSRHLEVTLWGWAVRRVALDNIESVSKRHQAWAEHWWSTWRPAGRRLMIRRRRGWPRNIIITPHKRYEFKARLEQAVQAATGRQLASSPIEPAPGTSEAIPPSDTR